MAKKQDKTNVMRILDEMRIPYTYSSYDNTKTNAVEVAEEIGQDPSSVFKTLVAEGKSGKYFVFMIPSMSELDLKKAAQAAGEKSMDMIPLKKLLPLTGYIHGGCSPIGMKKQFETYIDSSAQMLPEFCFSAGRVGTQIKLPLESLQEVLPVVPADLVKR